MGGELSAGRHRRTEFHRFRAEGPASGANLDRVQVVKGWVDAAGKAHEQVFDVVWSDMAKRKPVGGKVPAVGDTVDVATATYTEHHWRRPTLATVWTRSGLRSEAARVLLRPGDRNPDARAGPPMMRVRFKLKLAPEVRVKQQERAYTSAIWYTPAGMTVP